MPRKPSKRTLRLCEYLIIATTPVAVISPNPVSISIPCLILILWLWSARRLGCLRRQLKVAALTLAGMIVCTIAAKAITDLIWP